MLEASNFRWKYASVILDAPYKLYGASEITETYFLLKLLASTIQYSFSLKYTLWRDHKSSPQKWSLKREAFFVDCQKVAPEVLLPDYPQNKTSPF